MTMRTTLLVLLLQSLPHLANAWCLGVEEPQSSDCYGVTGHFCTASPVGPVDLPPNCQSMYGSFSYYDDGGNSLPVSFSAGYNCVDGITPDSCTVTFNGNQQCNECVVEDMQGNFAGTRVTLVDCSNVNSLPGYFGYIPTPQTSIMDRDILEPFKIGISEEHCNANSTVPTAAPTGTPSLSLDTESPNDALSSEPTSAPTESPSETTEPTQAVAAATPSASPTQRTGADIPKRWTVEFVLRFDFLDGVEIREPTDDELVSLFYSATVGFYHQLLSGEFPNIGFEPVLIGSSVDELSVDFPISILFHINFFDGGGKDPSEEEVINAFRNADYNEYVQAYVWNSGSGLFDDTQRVEYDNDTRMDGTYTPFLFNSQVPISATPTFTPSASPTKLIDATNTMQAPATMTYTFFPGTGDELDPELLAQLLDQTVDFFRATLSADSRFDHATGVTLDNIATDYDLSMEQLTLSMDITVAVDPLSSATLRETLLLLGHADWNHFITDYVRRQRSMSRGMTSALTNIHKVFFRAVGH